MDLVAKLDSQEHQDFMVILDSLASRDFLDTVDGRDVVVDQAQVASQDWDPVDFQAN